MSMWSRNRTLSRHGLRRADRKSVMSVVPRIIVPFGNLMLWGQERANIDALYALKQTGCEVLFLVRKEHWAEPLRGELSARGLSWVIAPFMRHRIGRSI